MLAGKLTRELDDITMREAGLREELSVREMQQANIELARHRARVHAERELRAEDEAALAGLEDWRRGNVSCPWRPISHLAGGASSVTEAASGLNRTPSRSQYAWLPSRTGIDDPTDDDAQRERDCDPHQDDREQHPALLLTCWLTSRVPTRHRRQTHQGGGHPSRLAASDAQVADGGMSRERSEAVRRQYATRPPRPVRRCGRSSPVARSRRDARSAARSSSGRCDRPSSRLRTAKNSRQPEGDRGVPQVVDRGDPVLIVEHPGPVGAERDETPRGSTFPQVGKQKGRLSAASLIVAGTGFEPVTSGL